MWYHAQAILGAGNRMYTGNVGLDMPYQFAFFERISTRRPAMYMYMSPVAFNLQNTWGWTSLSDMNTTSLTSKFSLDQRFMNLLATTTEENDLVNQVAQQLIFAINTFTVQQWKDAVDAYSTAQGVCFRSDPVSAYWGYTGSGVCLSHSVAHSLPVFRYHGVSTADTNTIVTWANAVFAVTGHDFATDTAATCDPADLPGGRQPAKLKCSNVVHP